MLFHATSFHTDSTAYDCNQESPCGTPPGEKLFGHPAESAHLTGTRTPRVFGGEERCEGLVKSSRNAGRPGQQVEWRRGAHQRHLTVPWAVRWNPPWALRMLWGSISRSRRGRQGRGQATTGENTLVAYTCKMQMQLTFVSCCEFRGLALASTVKCLHVEFFLLRMYLKSFF